MVLVQHGKILQYSLFQYPDVQMSTDQNYNDHNSNSLNSDIPSCLPLSHSPHTKPPNDPMGPILTAHCSPSGLNNLLAAYEDKSAYALCVFSLALSADDTPLTFSGRTEVTANR